MATGATTRRRVVVAVTDASTFEGDIVRGVLDYNEPTHAWDMAGQAGRMPFAEFDEIDLQAINGIILPIYEPRWAEEITRVGVPAVAVAELSDHSTLPIVTVDDRATGRLGGEHLLERGFAQFGFILQGEWNYSANRLAGFRQVIEEEAGRTCHALVASPDKDADDGPQIVRWLADLPKPIAIMAANDNLGFQAIEAAIGVGLRVPDDVAVLGADNNPWLVSSAAVPLSSIEHDFRRIGYRAAKLLEGLMDGELPTPNQFIPPLGVVTRRSTEITLADDPKVTAALAFIRDHFADAVKVDDVLEHVELSRTSLENKMKRAIGVTPHIAICRARVEHAKKLLVRTDQTMDEIARACGFLWQSQLNIVFKRLTGLTPGQFRQQRSGKA